MTQPAPAPAPAPAPVRSDRRYVPGPYYFGRSWLGLLAILLGVFWLCILGAGGDVFSLEFHREEAWALAMIFAGAHLVP